jgi:hypothetical protein
LRRAISSDAVVGFLRTMELTSSLLLWSVSLQPADASDPTNRSNLAPIRLLAVQVDVQGDSRFAQEAKNRFCDRKTALAAGRRKPQASV